MIFKRIRPNGFTLVELLIALAILGEIATFTIPKIVSAQQNTARKASAKEVFAMVSTAYDTYKKSTVVSASTYPTVLAPYMNYVAVDTTSTLDGSPNDNASYDCSQAGRNCLKLHNGGMLLFGTSTFGGTNTTNLVWFLFDPDAKYKGDASSVWGALYYTGRVTSWANVAAGSQDGGGTFNPGNYDPAWFNWN